NLTQARGETLPLDAITQRRGIGGVGLGVRLMLTHGATDYDPLDPEAPLIFAFAPLVGSSINTSAKAVVLSKSPLTRRLNDAMISSGFALVGKATGHDALVLTGQCPEWSVLFITPQGIRLEPAQHLLGLGAEETEAGIRERWGSQWSVAAIGPAGEALVPFATLSHDGRHAGRGGHGAVMGSKRLKALAVWGQEVRPPAHPEALDRIRKNLKQASLGPGTEKYRTTGTLGNLLVFNRLGVLPTDNFQRTGDDRAAGLSAEVLFQNEKITRGTCADCMIGCEKRVQQADGRSTRLEYENVFALGSLLGLWTLEEVLAATRRCDDLGLDTISTGGTLAFAVECAQRGWLDAPQLLNLNRDGVLTLLEAIARREGLGALLALGSRALAARLGPEAQAIAPHVKGLELPGYHLSGLQTLGLGLAVGARGADHNKSSAYDLDFSGTVDRFSLDPERVEAMIEMEDQAVLLDSLILCKFVRRALTDVYGESSAMLEALTGEAFPPEALRVAARETQHLKKLFNQRQGWSPEEDTLPQRFFKNGASGTVTAQDSAPGINHRDFLIARARYYVLRGWTQDGRLSPALEDLLEA
ncbi:MAG: aldehyde:ferredoxin oxidoreductase, partial [Deltaproteobacteria bacterium]|nr:aldehyde:ferredoxin oxidoreductase [Deltaproteobacteria bacterium]